MAQKVNIADIPDNMSIDDYPDDTIFVWSESEMSRDLLTGRATFVDNKGNAEGSDS